MGAFGLSGAHDKGGDVGDPEEVADRGEDRGLFDVHDVERCLYEGTIRVGVRRQEAVGVEVDLCVEAFGAAAQVFFHHLVGELRGGSAIDGEDALIRHDVRLGSAFDEGHLGGGFGQIAGNIEVIDLEPFDELRGEVDGISSLPRS